MMTSSGTIATLKNFARPVYRPIKRLLKALRSDQTPAELHAYWRKPPDRGNAPEMYINGAERSRFLMGVMQDVAMADARILEVGCNVGRNLAYLYQAGFRNLEGIEINADAVELLKKTFPEMAANTVIHVGPLETLLSTFDSKAFDVAYSMAVLEHIHPDTCHRVFRELRRVSRNLITIENECATSWKSFGRHYRQIFEDLGMQQIREGPCDHLPGLGPNYRMRIFNSSPRAQA